MSLIRAALVSSLLAAPLAFGQSMQVQVDDGDDDTNVRMDVNAPGMNVKVKVKDSSSTTTTTTTTTTSPRPPPMRVVGADTFDIRFERMGDEKVRVLSPEGARVDAWTDEGEHVGTYDVPCSFQGRGGRFYRVIVTAPSGEVLFDRKIEVKSFFRTLVQLRGPGPAITATPPPPTVVVVQAAPQPTMVDFPALLAAVKAESFSDEKLDVVSTSEGGLTIDQVGQLVDALAHSSDKVKVVQITRARIVDSQNAFKLYSHFTFDSDKKQVKALFGK